MNLAEINRAIISENVSRRTRLREWISLSHLNMDTVMDVFGCVLDAFWWLNIAGIVLRPLIYEFGSDMLYDALYGQPIYTYFYAFKFLLMPSFWFYLAGNEKMLKTLLWGIAAMAVLKKVIDFVEEGALRLRWGNRTALLTMSW